MSEQLPTEMRDLLIRLDTKVDNLTVTLQRIDQRADSHEQRIYKLEADNTMRGALVPQHHALVSRMDTIEDWRIASEAQLLGASKLATAMKSAFAAVGVLLSVLGYQVFIAPTHAPTSTSAN